MSPGVSDARRKAAAHAASWPIESGRAWWSRVKVIIDVRVAAIACLATIGMVAAILSIEETTVNDALRRFVLDMTHEDVAEDSGANDTLLRAYLASPAAPGTREVAIIGASYVATYYEPDPSARLYRMLEKRLFETSGEMWRVVNLASPGYDVWSYFFMARLLRERHPPEVLIVSIDTLRPMGRNRHLVLNGGDALSRFTADELAAVVSRNRVSLFRVEASLLERVRPHTGWLETLTRLRRLARAAAPAVRATAAAITGRDFATNNELTPGGRRKSWRELPSARAQIQAIRRRGARPDTMDDQTLLDLDRLGKELAAGQKAGIRVLVVTMPKIPVVPIDFDLTHKRLDAWARQYDLEFHDYWTSGIVPDADFSDTGHFFGDGCRIMGDELARLVLEERRR